MGCPALMQAWMMSSSSVGRLDNLAMSFCSLQARLLGSAHVSLYCTPPFMA